MIDKNRLDVEVKLFALEQIVLHLSKMVFCATGVSEEGVRQFRASCREQLSAQTLPGVDPAMADHVTAEIEAEVDRLAAHIERLVEGAWSQLRAAGVQPPRRQ
jgi:hypothetical protein